MPRMTLAGMRQYYDRVYASGDDPVYFWDNLIVPDDFNSAEIGAAIMLRSGDLYPYIQSVPAFVSDMNLWSRYRLADWQRMIDALTATYNPIENYDRHEDGIIIDAHHKGSKDYRTIEEQGSEKDAMHKGSTVTRTISEDGSETNEHHKGTKTSTSIEEIDTPRVQTQTDGSIVAFDSSSPTLANRTVTEPKSGTNQRTADPTKNYITTQDIDASTYDKDIKNFSDRETTETTTSEDIDASTYDYNEKTFNQRKTIDGVTHEDIDATHFDKDERSFNSYHVHGNIGVTKTQDMILSEIEVRKQNIVDIIAAEFEDKFIVQLY